MQSSGFEVEHAGVLSLIQDRGRSGWMSAGVSQSGVMDRWSAFWANRLVGNPLYSALIETAMGGLQIVAQAPTLICLTGAEVEFYINDIACELWHSYRIATGDRIRLGFPQKGLRNYLAIRGGIQVQPKFGSVSTSTREGIGGITGRGLGLQKGDIIPYFASQSATPLYLPKSSREWWQLDLGLESDTHFRVIPTGQYKDFSKVLRRELLTRGFEVSNDSNRMAYRLSGTKLPHELPGMLSEATGLGAIQVPCDGTPIVLLNERQSLGGYPKLGAVCSVDCWRLSQMKPGDVIRFQLISVPRAQRLAQELQLLMQETVPKAY